jgi:hypothetical protein
MALFTPEPNLFPVWWTAIDPLFDQNRNRRLNRFLLMPPPILDRAARSPPKEIVEGDMVSPPT